MVGLKVKVAVMSKISCSALRLAHGGFSEQRLSFPIRYSNFNTLERGFKP